MQEYIIDRDHPSLAGHFPGHPVVPAAVILSTVLTAARARWPDTVIGGLKKAKFLSPLAPGQAFSITWKQPQGDSAGFTCHEGETVLAQGRLLLTPSVQQTHLTA